MYPIARDIAVPIAKDAITNYMKGSGVKQKPKRGRPRKQQGGNFLDDAFKGIKSVGKEMYPIARDIAVPIVKDVAKDAITSYMKGSGMKRKPTKRNLMIKQLMQNNNMTLPQASKYIKEHNLA